MADETEGNGKPGDIPHASSVKRLHQKKQSPLRYGVEYPSVSQWFQCRLRLQLEKNSAPGKTTTEAHHEDPVSWFQNPVLQILVKNQSH